MNSPIVLHACEATTFESFGGDPVPCRGMGLWWTAPNGKAYILCEHHIAVFSVDGAQHERLD